MQGHTLYMIALILEDISFQKRVRSKGITDIIICVLCYGFSNSYDEYLSNDLGGIGLCQQKLGLSDQYRFMMCLVLARIYR